ncbi:MAG: response regulator [Planctomycetota bacterium]|nr:response regulator [Planctomycetota bacterium]
MATKRTNQAAQRIKRELEPLDRAIAEALEKQDPTDGPASILIVGREDDARNSLVQSLEEHQHRCIYIGRLDTALATASRGRFDILLVNPDLPDGDGLDLSRHVQKNAPATRTIIYGDKDISRCAMEAMRAGAIDVLCVPVSEPDLITSIELAKTSSRRDRLRDERLVRLKTICKELNVARHEISDQVDILCKDLVDAYQDMTEQINEVAMTSEYKTLLKQELDVEDLLRTALQYLLTKTGPTNAAVFLPDSDGQYGLGAYVNYDCPRESISVLLDHLCRHICPQMAGEDDIVVFDDADEFSKWIDADVEFLEDSQIISYSCRKDEECLAVIVLFRRKSDEFPPELAGTLDMMRVIFAEQLSHIIKVHHRATPNWPEEASWEDDVDDFGFGGYEGGLAA